MASNERRLSLSEEAPDPAPTTPALSRRGGPAKRPPALHRCRSSSEATACRS